MSDDSKPNQKVTGYLEKRGKLKLVNSWKRYWFVLEGHLLLYYGSKEEYDALSPCKGTITLGPTCNVKPYVSTPLKFQITTRTGSVITLRAETIGEQNKWLGAIYSTVNENQKFDIGTLCHFRYFTGRQDVFTSDCEEKKRNASPVPSDLEPTSPKTPEIEDRNLLGRLQKIGAKSYFDSMPSNRLNKIELPPSPRNLNPVLNEETVRSEKVVKESGLISPKKLHFFPKIPKINEEPKIEDGEVVLEEEDYCVCTFEKNDDSEVSEVNQIPRSISFSDARDLFEKSNLGTLSRESYLKSKEKSGCDKSLNDNNELNPTEKLGILVEKILHSPNLILKNISVPPISTGNNQAYNKDPKLSDSTKTSEPNKKHIDKYNKSGTAPQNQESQQNNQNNTEICSGSPKLSFSIETKKQGRRILGSENEENTVADRHQSYHDFRENELYAIPHEQENRPEKFGSSAELYDEPIFLEEIDTRKDKPDFQFPPPPNEAYESNVDLTSNSKYEDDQDSLYEEARDDMNEEFVWQNEIYASSVNSNKDPTYDEPTFQNQFNPDNKERTAHEIEEFEIDNDLYEEVDRNFEFLKTPTDEVVFENELYAEPNFHKDSSRPNSQAEFENDLYEEVNMEKYKDHKTEQQLGNDRNARSSKHSLENLQHHPHKNEEIDINDLYAKPIKRTNRELTKPYNVPSSTCSAEEILIQNELYANPDEVLHNDIRSISERTNLKTPNSPREELQIENDLYAEPNAVLCKDSSRINYNNKTEEKTYPPNKEIQHKEHEHHTEDCVELENEIYAEPNIISTGISAKIFSRQNSRTEQERTDMVESNKPNNQWKTFILINKLLHKKPRIVSTDTDTSVDLENELYAQSNLNMQTQESSALEMYDEPNLKGRTSLGEDLEDDDMHFYEDPDVLRVRAPKKEEHPTKKKKPKKPHKTNGSTDNVEAEEVKKQDGFIQRLLRQATKKHEDKSDKTSDLDAKDVDETLAILADIQVLLENKKKLMKQIVDSPKTSHRRILSESNAQLADRDKISASTSNDFPRSTSLKQSISIGLNDENLVVRKDNDVEIVDR